MTNNKNNKIVVRTLASTNRRQPMLLQPSGSSRVGEVVGGTVAVCCCCPCGVVFNILVMALYKVPYGLCRRMLRLKRRRKIVSEAYLQPKQRSHHNCSCGCCDVNGLRLVHPMCANDASDMKQLHSFEQPDKEAIALENEMWDKFYSTGFWRSSSRRETPPQNVSNNAVTTLSPKTQLVG